MTRMYQAEQQCQPGPGAPNGVMRVLIIRKEDGLYTKIDDGKHNWKRISTGNFTEDEWLNMMEARRVGCGR